MCEEQDRVLVDIADFMCGLQEVEEEVSRADLIARGFVSHFHCSRSAGAN